MEIHIFSILNFFITFFLPSLPKDFNVVSSNCNTSTIFLLNEIEFPASNKNPVLSLIIVYFDPPILLAIIGFSIDWASTEILPKASGSIEEETTMFEILYAEGMCLQ